MKTVLKYSLPALAFALFIVPTAKADPGGNGWDNPHNPHYTAPEVDPGLAFGGLALLGGTLTVLRSRRSK